MSYILALLKSNLKIHLADKKRIFIQTFFMLLQNLLFFLLWVLLFEVVSDLKGWELKEIARMYGMIALSFGVANFFFAGIRFLPQSLEDGSFETLLTKPRHSLLPMMCSASSSAALGDILAPVIIWPLWGDVSLEMLPMMLFMSAISCIGFVFAILAVYSTSLWLKGNSRFPDHLFEMLVIFSANVIHGQPFFVKAIAFTFIPAGFINYLPVQLLTHFDWADFAILIAGITVYACASLWFYNAGVRRYVRLSR